MDFNVEKSKILLSSSKSKLPHYSLHGHELEILLHGHELEILQEVMYLGVIIHSDMKFTAHIYRKLITANQQLSMIKRALYWVATNAKLLVYKTLHLPHLEYTAAAWDPSSRKDISDIELQDQAVLFIFGIKGWDGVEDAKTSLGLVPLHKRRRDQQLSLLMSILAKEEHHSSLSESYNEIMNQPTTTMTTRSQTRGIPATFRTSNTQFNNSFLPRTICDLNAQSEQTVSYSANTG